MANKPKSAEIHPGPGFRIRKTITRPDSAILEQFRQFPTPDISDLLNRLYTMTMEIKNLTNDLPIVGSACTVKVYPGDNLMVHKALDVVRPGDVIVVDAGGRPPAVWGELATQSCLQRKLAGVVVDGAVRDTGEIAALGFPCFARQVASACGEPKGHGEIGATLRIEGIEIHTGDWIVGDDDGLLVLPRAQAAEMANRAMDCLERENRIRGEIRAGRTTLGQVLELLRWEKR